MSLLPSDMSLLDLQPGEQEFLSEVIAGLSRRPRTLPCKFFYDQRGSELFQQICELPEYYITRTELSILKDKGSSMARALGPDVELIGLGTGAGTKTRLLLEKLERPAIYIPVDISSTQLLRSTTLFRQLFPNLEILPVCADYLQSIDLPRPSRLAERKVVYFPGSTIGNFEPATAVDFLRRIASLVHPVGGLLIGVDLKKDPAIIEAAYNDSQGVTADFNLNLLARINRELRGTFDLHLWKHRAEYQAAHGRIEMQLISQADQAASVGGQQFHFEPGEKIVTEHSHKHSPAEFEKMAGQAGFVLEKVWTDRAKLFGVFYFSLTA